MQTVYNMLYYITAPLQVRQVGWQSKYFLKQFTDSADLTGGGGEDCSRVTAKQQVPLDMGG